MNAAEAKLKRSKKLVEKAENDVSDIMEKLKSVQEALEAAKEKVIVAKENYKDAEFQLEVIKRNNAIEEIFWRFPHLGSNILELVDNESLVKCYEVNKWWQKYIDGC